MAYIVGVMLLILVVGMFFKYALDNESLIVVAGPIHGFLYVIYLITTVDLALKVKYSIGRTLLIMLAGTIPFLSFVAEHFVAKDVKARLAETSPA